MDLLEQDEQATDRLGTILDSCHFEMSIFLTIC